MDYNNFVNPNSMRIGSDGKVYLGETERFGEGGIIYPISVPQGSLVDFSNMAYLERVRGINVRVGVYDIKLKQNPLSGGISATIYYDSLDIHRKVVVPKSQVEEILKFIKCNSEQVPIVS